MGYKWAIQGEKVVDGVHFGLLEKYKTKTEAEKHRSFFEDQGYTITVGQCRPVRISPEKQTADF
jgi:hypothetical protein